jgi:hypothetical protein
MVNFYQHFLPGLDDTVKPLTDALVQTIFEAAKAALAAATPLARPSCADATVSIGSDVSDT